MRRIIAPWSDAVVAALNRWQRDPHVHPFTCGNDRADADHVAFEAEHSERDLGVLVAHPDGWHCPVCDYRQDWAHTFMAEQHPEPE